MSESVVTLPRLLTVRELSEATGLQMWRVYEMLQPVRAREEAERKEKEYKGPTYDGPPVLRIGRTFRFPADGVAKWIAERTNTNGR